MVRLGLEPGGGSMEGADKSNDLWRHPFEFNCQNHVFGPW